MNITILETAEFREYRSKWNALLAHSGADPLFLSWDWLYNWWEIHGGQPGDKLFILIAESTQGELAGIAPLYLQTRYMFNKKLSSRRVQFLGSTSRVFDGFRSENMQFIVKQGYEKTVAPMLLDYVFQHSGVDDYYFADTVMGSSTHVAIQEKTTQYGLLPRIQSMNPTYEVDCRQDFSTYVAALGKNTRLKAFNRRKVLQQHGKIEVLNITERQIEDIFKPFTRFYRQRWEADYSPDNQLTFLQRISKHDNIQAGGLLLVVNGETIACTIDVICGNKAYNLQMGFVDEYDRKISLGTLMLGYAVEHYCLHPQVESYDLLAGSGKNSNYKTRLASVGCQLESPQLIRALHLKALYHGKDLITAVRKKWAS